MIRKIATYGGLKHHITNKKFGRNTAVGTSFVPITIGGNFQTPTVLTTLRISSSSANDTSDGTGARTVRVTGIGAGYVEITKKFKGKKPQTLAKLTDEGRVALKAYRQSIMQVLNKVAD